MTPTRAAVEAQLQLIKRRLEIGRPLDKQERELLAAAIGCALDGEQNPFRLPLGKRDTKARDLALAQRVHELIAEHIPPNQAIDRVADEAGLSGQRGGTVAKAWAAHRADIEGTAPLFLARSENRDLTDSERQQFDQTLDALFPDPPSRGK
jgi:hypothetical protein